MCQYVVTSCYSLCYFYRNLFVFSAIVLSVLFVCLCSANTVLVLLKLAYVSYVVGQSSLELFWVVVCLVLLLVCWILCYCVSVLILFSKHLFVWCYRCCIAVVGVNFGDLSL